MQFTPREFIIYAAVAGTALGLVFGIIVLILGIRKNKRKLGIIGFIVTLVAGPVSGVVSLIVAGVFVWLIYRKPAEDAGRDSADDATEEPKDR